MEKQKAIEVLNSMEIVESESDDDIMIFIYVDNSAENREKLMSLGVSEYDVNMGTNDHKGENDVLDLSHFAWSFAQWFDGERFLDYIPN